MLGPCATAGFSSEGLIARRAVSLEPKSSPWYKHFQKDIENGVELRTAYFFVFICGRHFCHCPPSDWRICSEPWSDRTSRTSPFSFRPQRPLLSSATPYHCEWKSETVARKNFGSQLQTRALPSFSFRPIGKKGCRNVFAKNARKFHQARNHSVRRMDDSRLSTGH